VSGSLARGFSGVKFILERNCMLRRGVAFVMLGVASLSLLLRNRPAPVHEAAKPGGDWSRLSGFLTPTMPERKSAHDSRHVLVERP